MTPSELRTTLYQDHDAVAALRREAVELFLRSEGYLSQTPDPPGKALDPSPKRSDLHPHTNLTPDAQSESGESLEGTGTWRAQAPLQTQTRLGTSGRRSDRGEGLGFKARRNSTTKSTVSATATSRGTVRGRPRGNTMERRRTITAATHPRPIVGPLARLDSLVSQAPQTNSQVSPLSPQAPVQSRRRKYAVEHGLSHTSGHAPFIPPSSFSTFDPLHIPSLVRLAIEGLLLGPLRLRLSRLLGRRPTFDSEKVEQEREQEQVSSAAKGIDQEGKMHMRSGSSSFVPIALIAGAFCAGMGVGVVLARSRF